MDIDPPATKAGKAGKKAGVSQALEDEDPDTVQLRAIMGFAGFRSTKNTKVPGNDIYAVRKEKKTEYRQYMNRVGGFNRPLSPSRQ
jgi:U4/U6.U5 tri-snRNP-associated protein 3